MEVLLSNEDAWLIGQDLATLAQNNPLWGRSQGLFLGLAPWFISQG